LDQRVVRLRGSGQVRLRHLRHGHVLSLGLARRHGEDDAHGAQVRRVQRLGRPGVRHLRGSVRGRLDLVVRPERDRRRLLRKLYRRTLHDLVHAVSAQERPRALRHRESALRGLLLPLLVHAVRGGAGAPRGQNPSPAARPVWRRSAHHVRAADGAKHGRASPVRGAARAAATAVRAAAAAVRAAAAAVRAAGQLRRATQREHVPQNVRKPSRVHSREEGCKKVQKESSSHQTSTINSQSLTVSAMFLWREYNPCVMPSNLYRQVFPRYPCSGPVRRSQADLLAGSLEL
jgi:hypothetical protein